MSGAERQARYNDKQRLENAEVYRLQQRAWAKGRYDRRKATINACKVGRGCSVCHTEYRPWCLDFHHANPSDKSFNIAASVSKHSIVKLLAETEKCVLVCANCHRDIHFRERAEKCQ